MMTLYDRVKSCTVRIVDVADPWRYGTGFFVAPGLVLTCAHVVEPAKGAGPHRFEVRAADKVWTGLSPSRCWPRPEVDLALIEVPDIDHPCALLGAAADPFQELWTEGYTRTDDRYGNLENIRLEPVALKCEGELSEWVSETGGVENAYIKFQGGQIKPGMSGAPLLNIDTGAICGVVARSRDINGAAGGLAVPFRLILSVYGDIARQNAAFHAAHPEWSLSKLVMPWEDSDRDRKLAAVKQLPAGPAVPLSMVPQEVKERLFEMTPQQCLEFLQAANEIRRKANPERKTTEILVLDYPQPGNGVPAFWTSVFLNACPRGPRMIAALLYALPSGTFVGLEDEITELFRILRSWPIN